MTSSYEANTPPYQRQCGAATPQESAPTARLIENVAIADLRPYANNARTHSPKQITQIAASFKEFGVVNPILIDEDNRILAGHGRVAAAKSLGHETIPAVRVTHLNEAQRRAYILADNKLATLAGWDPEILKIELQYLTEIDLDFSVEVTGFSTAEIDLTLDRDAGVKRLRPSKADRVPPVSDVAISRLGDLWRIGDHALLVGDALEADNYARLLGDEHARMVFTDPPWNVPINGHAGGLGATPRREFVMASGEMTPEQFTGILTRAFTNLANFSVDGSIHYICMDFRHMRETLDAGASYDEMKNLVVWAKDNGGMGSFYRSQHELIFVFKRGTAKHINNFGLGESGRYRTNVWSYPGMNGFGPDRDAAFDLHPTVKPVALVADAIRDVSARGDIVLDAFAGSGTTGTAAQKTGRRSRLMELDPLYADVIIKRFDAVYGLKATLAATGATFAEIAAERAAAAV